MFGFTENILYFMIYLYFNIWVFTQYKGDALRYFSVIFQFITLFNIISNFESYIPTFNHIVYDILIILTLWIICVGELKNIRGD